MASKKTAPKKAPAKKAAPVATKKVAKAPVAVKAKPTPAKKETKVIVKKSEKPVVKKEAPKKEAPKKVVAKVEVKKEAPKKAVAKPSVTPVKNAKTTKEAPAKKVAAPAKPAVKANTKVTPAPASTGKKVDAKAPAKKEDSKPEPAKKVAAKKEEVKKEVVAKKVDEPKKAEAKEKKVPKSSSKKEAPKKVIVAPINKNIPKKIDAFKTNTFATSNLKNESGKVIAHRKTSELKRKTEETKPKKYIPELSRSILDMSQNANTTSYRYSDEDLMEFKELIQRKLDTAKAELQYLQGVIMRRDESGTEDTENKYQNMEDGSASMDREQLNQLASRQVTFITHLEQALVRIENKTYGICRETGKLIDKARLRAVPHATLSIEAKNAKKN